MPERCQACYQRAAGKLTGSGHYSCAASSSNLQHTPTPARSRWGRGNTPPPGLARAQRKRGELRPTRGLAVEVEGALTPCDYALRSVLRHWWRDTEAAPWGGLTAHADAFPSPGARTGTGVRCNPRRIVSTAGAAAWLPHSKPCNLVGKTNPRRCVIRRCGSGKVVCRSEWREGDR